MEATKHDSEKVRYDLIPVRALHEVAEVLTFGAKKYSDYNYLGLKKSRLFGALLRHSYAWVRGEGPEEETGKSHLAHAICCALMLRHQETVRDGDLQGVELDDPLMEAAAEYRRMHLS